MAMTWDDFMKAVLATKGGPRLALMIAKRQWAPAASRLVDLHPEYYGPLLEKLRAEDRVLPEPSGDPRTLEALAKSGSPGALIAAERKARNLAQGVNALARKIFGGHEPHWHDDGSFW